MTTTRQLTAGIAERAQLSRAQVKAALDALQELIIQSINHGEDVRFGEIGTFRRAERAARTGRNPQTGAPVEIRASVSVKFKASTTVTERLTGTRGRETGPASDRKSVV